MDTWLIAQCMAKLPRLTYFSHPESSLDDFYCGEASTITDANQQGEHSSRPAPHELQFLRSLSQSLGIDPLTTNSRAVGIGPYHYLGRASPGGRSSDSASSHPRTTAGERAMSQQFDDCRSVASTGEICASLSGPMEMPNSPFRSCIQGPATSSATPHVVSCVGDEPSLQPRNTTNADSNNSTSRYQCNWEVSEGRPCGEWIKGGSKEVWIHVRTAHGLKGKYGGWCHCRWGGCLEKLRVSSLRRHLAKHLEIRWRCSGCDTVFSRYDYVRRHTKRNEECRGADCYPLCPGDSDRERSTW